MSTSEHKPIPPKIAPKPGHVKVVRALYSYTAQQDDELSFAEGDVLYIQQDSGSDPNWWKARCGTKSGLIPSNYVELKVDAVENPAHDAARRGSLDFLSECLVNGVSPTGLDSSGNTPLHWASRGGHIECVTALIHAGIKYFGDTSKFINTQNRLGETPLHLAASKDHLEIVEILLEHGAFVKMLNKHNQSPLDLSHEPSVKSLLKSKLIQQSEDQVILEEDIDEYFDESEDD